MFFFFQAEDGIRDRTVTGVQTCALPIYRPGKPEDKMGLRASNTVALTLEDVRLPADHVLGDEGEGFGYAMEALDEIGRASCRERVEMSEGAVSVKGKRRIARDGGCSCSA